MLGNELMNNVLTLLLAGLRIATKLEVESLDVYNDSQFVVTKSKEITSPKIFKW